MGIEWFRDLVIIIFGASGALVFVMLFIRSFSIFKKVDAILASLKTASGNAEEISTLLRNEVVKPLAHIGSLVKNIQRWLDFFSSMFKKRGKEANDA